MGSGAPPRRLRTVVDWYRPAGPGPHVEGDAALLLGLPLGIAWFTILVTGLSVSAPAC